jgi:hypothetical protein
LISSLERFRETTNATSEPPTFVQYPPKRLTPNRQITKQVESVSLHFAEAERLNRMSSVKRRCLECRECARQPKAHGKREAVCEPCLEGVDTAMDENQNPTKPPDIADLIAFVEKVIAA